MSTFTLPSPENRDIHSLTNGLQFRWLGNHHEACIKLTNNSHDTVDAFLQLCYVLIEISGNNTLYAIADISDPSFTFTPYVRTKIHQLRTEVHERGVRGRRALLLPGGTQFRFVFNIVGLMARPRIPDFHERSFVNEDAAIAWVLEHD